MLSILPVLEEVFCLFLEVLELIGIEGKTGRIIAAFFHTHTQKKIFCRKRNQVLIKLLLALHSLNYYSGGAGNAVKEHD